MNSPRSHLQAITSGASNLVHSILDTTFRLSAIAASIVLIGKEAPKDSALSLAGKSIVERGNSIAEQVVKMARADLKVEGSTNSKSSKVE